MTTYYVRREEELQDPMGNGVSGVSIYVCQQPSNTGTVPPSPLAPVFADATGTALKVNPPQTDAYGSCSYYVAPGTYDIVYFSTQIATPTQTIVLKDQIVAAEGPTFKNDTSTNGSVAGSINGVNASFMLSAAPNPPASLVLMVNGILQYAYAFSGQTFVLQHAPQAGDVITAQYQVI